LIMSTIVLLNPAVSAGLSWRLEVRAQFSKLALVSWNQDYGYKSTKTGNVYMYVCNQGDQKKSPKV
jgi:hypothetical protein